MNMNVSNMSSLSACSMGPDTKPMQFPLAQRRKRRVLFTQAQVSPFILTLCVNSRLSNLSTPTDRPTLMLLIIKSVSTNEVALVRTLKSVIFCANLFNSLKTKHGRYERLS